MSKDENLENQGLKVSDRRRFNADGSPVEDEPADSPVEDTTFAKGSESNSKPAAEPEAAAPGSDFSVSFAGLVLSLAAGAQSGLGLAPNPLTGKVEKNLNQAKQSIDLLGVLEQKTKGNLEPEEAKLVQALLYDLRLQYLEATKVEAKDGVHE